MSQMNSSHVANMNKIDIRRIDLNLLVVFEAVFREGTVTRASEKLHQTQSSVSHALGRLRTVFNDPLFHRQNNVMTPTPMARELYRPVLAALRILEDSLNQAPLAEPVKTWRKLTIGLITTDEAAFLPQLLARQEAEPKYEIVTALYDPGKFESRLATGKFDVVMQPLSYHTPNVLCQPLASEGLALVIRREHPALHAGRLDLESYFRLQHVVVAPRRMESDFLDMEFSRLRLQRQVVLRCQDYWTACRIVARSDYILTAPRRSMLCLADEMPNNLVLPLPEGLNMLEAVEIFLYWHASADQNPDNRWLRENLCAIFQEPEVTAT